MKVLVANRGEIALRIIRACQEHGVTTVAVYADCDRRAPYVQQADEAVGLGANEPSESYLAIHKIVAIAQQVSADAIHPGYGFLAENADFARAVEQAGLTFIGPSSEGIALMGGKTAARQVAERAGVPTVPGTDGPLSDDATDGAIREAGALIGYPLFVKAVAGGGGKGMRLVRDPDLLLRAVQSARSEAASAFGNGDVYLERCIEQGRHIEVQLLADKYGTVVPFVERECSIQRRHQKVIEETPSPVIKEQTRRALADAAVRLAKEVGYTNAGTIECLFDELSDEFYFLEMNTRLQVEHPITEMVTGIDLVRWQLRIAEGERLTIDQETALTPKGHAIECRVYAEDPAAGFMPSPGVLTFHRLPEGPGVRVDCGVEPGFEVPIYYDSMISKVIAHASDRPASIERMLRALAEYEVVGVPTTIPMFRWLLATSDFGAARFDTTYLDGVLLSGADVPFVDIQRNDELEDLAVLAAAVSIGLGGSRVVRTERTNRGRRGDWRHVARAEGLR